MFVRIEATLQDQFKVTWGNNWGLLPETFSIGAVTLRKAAEGVRDRLQDLSAWAVTRRPETRRERLEGLVKAGQTLYNALFHDPQNRKEIVILKQWIAGEYDGGDHQLVVQADPSLHVPWGLVYEPPAAKPDRPATDPAAPDTVAGTGSLVDDDLPDELELARREMSEFAGFWSLRFRLSVVNQVRTISKFSRPRKSFGLLSLVNRKVQAEVEQALGSSGYRELCETPPVGIAHTLADCHELIERTDRSDILLHFLGHHAGEQLDLGNGETITYEDFALLIDDLAQHTSALDASPYGLLFLNGCDSAVGQGDYSLRREAMRSELAGVVATESTVQKRFAATFGYRFLKAMVEQGDTVSTAITTLRQAPDLWPESLFYGLYAHPNYRIEPAAA